MRIYFYYLWICLKSFFHIYIYTYLYYQKSQFQFFEGVDHLVSLKEEYINVPSSNHIQYNILLNIISEDLYIGIFVL